jgi:hypothetical protein
MHHAPFGQGVDRRGHEAHAQQGDQSASRKIGHGRALESGSSLFCDPILNIG